MNKKRLFALGLTAALTFTFPSAAGLQRVSAEEATDNAVEDITADLSQGTVPEIGSVIKDMNGNTYANAPNENYADATYTVTEDMSYPLILPATGTLTLQVTSNFTELDTTLETNDGNPAEMVGQSYFENIPHILTDEGQSDSKTFTIYLQAGLYRLHYNVSSDWIDQGKGCSAEVVSSFEAINETSPEIRTSIPSMDAQKQDDNSEEHAYILADFDGKDIAGQISLYQAGSHYGADTLGDEGDYFRIDPTRSGILALTMNTGIPSTSLAVYPALKEGEYTTNKIIDQDGTGDKKIPADQDVTYYGKLSPGTNYIYVNCWNADVGNYRMHLEYTQTPDVKLTNTSGRKLNILLSDEGADQYNIQVSTDRNFSKQVKNTTAAGLKKTLGNCKKKKTYYVRVQSVKGGLTTDWSSAKKIKIKK